MAPGSWLCLIAANKLLRGLIGSLDCNAVLGSHISGHIGMVLIYRMQQISDVLDHLNGYIVLFYEGKLQSVAKQKYLLLKRQCPRSLRLHQ
jgi:hypothetical protein